SRLLAQVVRSAVVLAALMQSTEALTQFAVPVTTVGRWTWTIEATHSASVVAQAAVAVAVFAELGHSGESLVQGAASEVALFTWAGRPLLAVATHWVYWAGQTSNPKSGFAVKQELSCVWHCATVRAWAVTAVCSSEPCEPTGPGWGSTPAAQPPRMEE